MCVEVARNVSRVELDYSPGSLKYLDSLIPSDGEVEREPPEGVILAMGCYLGETIIRHLGGRWSWEGPDAGLTQPHVQIGTQKVNVFGKVRKRFRYGESDSLAWFYQVVAAQHREVEDEHSPGSPG